LKNFFEKHGSMYQSVLKNINAELNSAKHISTKLRSDDYKPFGCEDEKSTLPSVETAMDYVNRAHDFTIISEEDLSAVFCTLRKRCPLSWTAALENRVWLFHEKIMTLQYEKSISKHIDPQTKLGNSKSKTVYDAKDAVVSTELWNMENMKAGIELKQLLQHSTMHAPVRPQQSHATLSLELNPVAFATYVA